MIDVLAQKLGVAANEIYSVLQTQAKVEIANDIILLLFCAGTIALTVIFAKMCFWDKRRGGETIYEHCDVPGSMAPCLLITALVALVITSAILFVCSISGILEIITCALNPKYWALNKIMSMIAQ